MKSARRRARELQWLFTNRQVAPRESEHVLMTQVIHHGREGRLMPGIEPGNRAFQDFGIYAIHICFD